jgi:hypothetical protein
MGDLLGAGVLFLLGWLMQGKRSGPAPRTPSDVPWPREGQRPLTPAERAEVQKAIHPSFFEPLSSKAKRAAKEAFGPSPLSDVSEYRKATRPGGRVIAPDLPKSDWREPSASERAAESMLHALDDTPGKA